MEETNGIRLNKWPKLALKVVVSLVLLSVVIYFIGLDSIIEVFKSVRPVYFILVLVIGFIGIALSSWKWQVLLEAVGEKKKFLLVWKHYYIGVFFNMFLPTSIGGDVIKAYKMSKMSKDPVRAYSSVFVERFTGAAAILVLALVATTIYIKELPLEIILVVYFVFPPILIMISVFFLKKDIVKRFGGIYRPIFKLLGRFSWDEKVKDLYNSIHSYHNKRRTIAIVLAMSLVFQVIVVVNNYLLATSIDMNVPIHFFFIFIPITVLISMLPISIRGIGIREVLFIYFFTQVGATGAQAVSLAFLGLVFNLLLSLAGGIIYLVEK